MYLQRAMINTFVFLLILYFPVYTVAKENMVWRSNADYVAIVPIEKGANKNDHPVNLSIEGIYTLLESIHITDGNNSILDLFRKNNEDNFGVSPLFSTSELRQLSIPIAKAFSKASPHEDIVFSITGQHEDAIGKSDLSTAARLFHRDNNIHIIIGDMRVSLAKKYRRRGGHSDRTPSADKMKLRNFRLKTGSRSRETELSSRLVTDKYHVLNRNQGKLRNDWMVINVGEMKNYISKDRELRKKNDKLVEETPSLKVEIENIDEQQEVGERKVDPLERSLQAREQAEKSTPLDGHESGKNLEERLTELKKLRDKNLISEEIYEEKVKTLLKEL